MYYNIEILLLQSYPLEDIDKRRHCLIQESLADLYRFQLESRKAKNWYHKALDTVNGLLNGLMEANEYKYTLEIKGKCKIRTF